MSPWDDARGKLHIASKKRGWQTRVHLLPILDDCDLIIVGPRIRGCVRNCYRNVLSEIVRARGSKASQCVNKLLNARRQITRSGACNLDARNSPKRRNRCRCTSAFVWLSDCVTDRHHRFSQVSFTACGHINSIDADRRHGGGWCGRKLHPVENIEDRG